MRIDFESDFASDTLRGLSKKPRSLSCKWFYDEIGSKLFEEITQTDEYYPTRVETGLLIVLSPEISKFIPGLAAVIEPGSGSSAKTRILLESQPNLQTYIPIDISEEFLMAAANRLTLDFPMLEIMPVTADFSATMPSIELAANLERMVFFPGSTIGNFAPEQARRLLRNIRKFAGRNAWLLIGVDMTQHEESLLAAYNDAGGITAKFNKNLLIRANRELGADFEAEFFQHRALFNPIEHRIEMHLICEKKQKVHINGHIFSFKQGETIHTENCYKYSRDEFESMIRDCGWKLQQYWEDRQKFHFGVFLLKSVD